MVAVRSLVAGLLVFLLSCQSSGPERETAGLGASNFSVRHLKLKSSERPADCCQATGAQIAISSGGAASSQCGMDIHNQGGNAVDVATAVAFCLSVERPQSAGLGGGGFMMLSIPGKMNRPVFVDFRETAPAKASKGMYLDAAGKEVPGKSLQGALAVATPGFVAGFYDVHKKYGKLPWARVLAPSAELARRGFPVYPHMVEKIQEVKAALNQDEEMKTILTKDGRWLGLGDVLIQENLAKTIDLIGAGGKDVFYKGIIGKELAGFVESKGGILTLNDLRRYKVVTRSPLEAQLGDSRIFTAPPPSAGGVILIELANILGGIPRDQLLATQAGYLHLVAESFKRAYADRTEYIGDPAFYKDKAYLKLISPAYAAQARASIRADKATPSSEIRPGQYLLKDHPETTQLSVMDNEGTAISATITVNYYFGAGVGLPGRGFVLNDEMNDFVMDPKAQKSGANVIEPGKRPLSSMTPTLVFREGKPVLAVGAPGGAIIASAVTNVVLNYLLVYPGDLHKAILAPRLHHRWLPDRIELELDGVPSSVVDELKAKGHTVEAPRGPHLVEGVARGVPSLWAVFDPRDEGGALAK